MGDDIVEEKNDLCFIAFYIYLRLCCFCGDGVGKKFVEEKFSAPLHISDKECDDSKKKELRIVEDEDTAGGISLI